jgi:lactonase
MATSTWRCTAKVACWCSTKNGIPIGQVLLPGRDEGHNLQSTNMVIRPDTNDLYIVTNDRDGGQGATIFHAKVFANALLLYSHQ